MEQLSFSQDNQKGGASSAKLSPMMQQYLDLKAQHKDHILFFRLGDFYEMFFDDAITASKELDLVLTGRDCGMEERAPMCGVPHHSCEGYLARLVEKGYKVAICEQVEDPALSKGLVKRDVVRVVTKGTILENSMLDEAKHNYIASILLRTGAAALCFCDVSTGSLFATEITQGNITQKVFSEIVKFEPSEILLNKDAAGNKELRRYLTDSLMCTLNLIEEADYSITTASATVPRQFGVSSLAELPTADMKLTPLTLDVLLHYLHTTQKTGLERIAEITVYNEEDYLVIDASSRRSLELTQTIRTGDKKGSLLHVLDRTTTAMGKRLLRTWIEQPLLNVNAINARLGAVEELVSKTAVRMGLLEALDGVSDVERLLTKIVYGSANARDLRAVCAAAGRLSAIKSELARCDAALLAVLHDELDTLDDIHAKIEKVIMETPPIPIKEGGMVKRGVNAELDELHDIVNNTKAYLSEIEGAEREKTGIKNLKIAYNRVFGYYIEITKSYIKDVPEHYIRKQTLVGSERYITPELKTLEDKIVSANERICLIEYDIFEEIRKFVARNLGRVSRSAHIVAQLDVLLSFAVVSLQNNYVKPTVTTNGVIDIKDGRHPVIERALAHDQFVPNDCRLDEEGHTILIITGPNMAGKSTYMRQVALITLMAQMGCFVPAREAEICATDRIFTRVGASDDLFSGQSTFMVEMSETAQILKNATPRSLIILDEIGRGTSTFDGMSIARAVIEYIAENEGVRAKTLFATHYHELCDLEQLYPCVKNYNTAVKRDGEDIVFLRRVVRGGADDSYGIEVAKLAGVPAPVTARARDILRVLEQAESRSARDPADAANVPAAYDLRAGAVVDALDAIDVNTLSPLEALNELNRLQSLGK